MTVLFVGASHATAPLALLERLAFAGDDARRLLARVGATVAPADGGAAPADRPLPVRELIILSTCHRIELYAVAAAGHSAGDVLGALATAILSRAESPDDAAPSLRRLIGADAERHLCRVAAGLESMVLGESEILGQVSDALAAASTAGAAGLVLTGAFEAAVRAGRRARAETRIGCEPASVSSIAAELAEELADDLRGRRALIVGAGKMGTLAAKALRARGYWEMTVASRTAESAAALAAAVGGCSVPMESLGAALADTDLVIASSAASRPVIDVALVRAAMRGRVARPLTFIDIAVPRDVDPDVRELAGVHVVDMDDLRERVERAIAGRRREVPMVEAIVEEELRGLHARGEGAALMGVVRELRVRAEALRQREVARTLARLPGATPEVRDQIERLSTSLVNQLLDEPTRRLRDEARNGHAKSYADVARTLFGLLPDALTPPLAEAPTALHADRPLG